MRLRKSQVCDRFNWQIACGFVVLSVVLSCIRGFEGLSSVIILKFSSQCCFQVSSLGEDFFDVFLLWKNDCPIHHPRVANHCCAPNSGNLHAFWDQCSVVHAVRSQSKQTFLSPAAGVCRLQKTGAFPEKDRQLVKRLTAEGPWVLDFDEDYVRCAVWAWVWAVGGSSQTNTLSSAEPKHSPRSIFLKWLCGHLPKPL